MVKKLREVFTKEYQKEAKYQKFTLQMVDIFKLKNQSENVEDKVKRLKDKSFVSNFKLNVGEY